MLFTVTQSELLLTHKNQRFFVGLCSLKIATKILLKPFQFHVQWANASSRSLNVFPFSSLVTSSMYISMRQRSRKIPLNFYRREMYVEQFYFRKIELPLQNASYSEESCIDFKLKSVRLFHVFSIEKYQQEIKQNHTPCK